jgi:gamma-glutamyltranspeptidase/glutathione hydrolase
MLNILEACMPKWAPGQTLASLGPANAKYWHLMIEAKKLAYADLYRYNADPNAVDVPTATLLSKPYAASLCGRVNPSRASVPGPKGKADGNGDTSVLSVGDSAGNMVSWVNSNFDEFGSGITVPGYGFILHNRGSLFSLDPKSPNVIAPRKRPFNTPSAGFVMKDNRPVMTVTLMGGDMQAQGHEQILVDVFDLGANLQAAADMARYRHSQVSNVLRLELPLFRLIGSQLTALGHDVRSINGRDVGGVQWLMFTPNADGSPGGFYRAGSDFRKDGQAAGW